MFLSTYRVQAPQRVFYVTAGQPGLTQTAREIVDALHSPVRRVPWSADRIFHSADRHAQRVSAMAVRLGRAAGLSDGVLSSLGRGALLHDLGKEQLPGGLLGKSGALTDHEWILMRRHPQLGFDLARGQGIDDRQALLVILHHHERWDGTGYPMGLKHRTIPLVARITALCDVFDALISKREYKDAWSLDRALDHIKAAAGTQFDPDLTGLFLDSEPYSVPV